MEIKERIHRLRNFQSDDFWAMIFARPLTILFLIPLIEKKWVTPNRLTVLSFLTKIAAVLLIAFNFSYIGGIWGAILINLGLVFDNMDGTVARFRNSGSYFGYFFDKATDAISFVLLFWAMGFRAYHFTHSIIDLILPFAGVTGAFIANYSKWVADHVLTDIEIKENLNNNTLETWAKKRTQGFVFKEPPKRTVKDWIKWFFSAIISILKFNEVDIYFWSALALITEKYWIFTRFDAFFLIFGLFGGPVAFLIKVYKAEKKLNQDKK